MRKIDDSPIYNTIIDACISEITNNLVKEDEKALFETVGAHGERLNSPEGRLINPGHSMETAWFLMEEAALRKDAELMKKAIQITEWSSVSKKSTRSWTGIPLARKSKIFGLHSIPANTTPVPLKNRLFSGFSLIMCFSAAHVSGKTKDAA